MPFQPKLLVQSLFTASPFKRSHFSAVPWSTSKSLCTIPPFRDANQLFKLRTTAYSTSSFVNGKKLGGNSFAACKVETGSVTYLITSNLHLDRRASSKVLKQLPQSTFFSRPSPPTNPIINPGFWQRHPPRTSRVNSFCEGLREDKKKWDDKDFYNKGKLVFKYLVAGGGLFAIWDSYKKYRNVANEGVRILRELKQDAKLNTDQPIKLVSDVVAYFEKTQALQELKQEFIRHNTIVISGASGTGKTELVRAFAKDYESTSPGIVTIFYMQANNMEEIERGCRAMVRELNLNIQEDLDISNIIARINEVFEHRSKCLFIFDNVSDYSLIEKCSLHKLKGKKLITTSVKLQGLPNEHYHLSLDQGMLPSEAVRLLTKMVDNRDKAELNVLAKHLGYIPLAMALSGAYLAQNSSIHIQEYLEKVLQERKRLLKEQANPVAAINDSVLHVVLDSILHNRDANNNLREMLNILVFFGATEIPLECFDTKQDTLEFNFPQEFSKHTTFQQLKKYLLINESTSGQAITIHPNVQRVVRSKIEEKQTGEYLLKACDVLWPIFGFDNANKEKAKRNTNLLPHVLSIIKHFQLDEKLIEVPALRINIARYCAVIGNYHMQFTGLTEQSNKYLKLAKQLCETGQTNLCKEKAKEIFNKLVNIDKRLPSIYALALHYLGKVNFMYKKDHSQTFVDLMKLAFNLREVIDKNKLHCEDIDDNPQFNNTSLFNRILAGVYYEQGSHAEAEQIYQTLLSDHPKDTFNQGICYLQLAKIYKQKWLYAQAIFYAKEAIKAAGNNHSKLAVYYNVLADVYLAKGDSFLSREKYLETLKLCKGSSENSFMVADAHEGLARILEKQLDFISAHKHIKKCVKIRKFMYSENHKDLQRALEYEQDIRAKGLIDRIFLSLN